MILDFLKRSRPYLLLLLLAVSIYGSSLLYPLLYWDDFKHICENGFVNSPTWQGFSSLWGTPYFGMYIPLTYTFWLAPVSIAQFIWPSADCIQWGPVFHFFNLALHIANSILVFRILYRISGNQMGALLGAAIFCGHPMQVEAVVWVSGARDLLSAFCGLSGVALFMVRKKTAANVFMILAVLAKPSGVVFPFLAFALELRDWRSHLRSLLPALIASVLASLVMQGVQGSKVDLPEVSIGLRVLLMFSNVGFYLWKALWPVDLIPIYPRSIEDILSDMSLLWLAVVPIVVLIFLLKDRQRVYWPAALWIFIPLIPVSGLFAFGFQGISTVADRYFYLSMVGVSMIVAMVLTGKYRYGLALLSLSIFAILSFRQVDRWQNDEVLFKHTIRVNPNATSAHSSLGFYYMRQLRFVEGEEQFRQALGRNRKHLSSWLGLGRILEHQGKVAESEEVYRTAIRNQTAVPEVFNNLGAILYLRGDLAESAKQFAIAAKGSPHYMEPRYNLGQIYLDTGKYRDALDAFSEAERVAPGNEMVLLKMKEAQQKLSLE